MAGGEHHRDAGGAGRLAFARRKRRRVAAYTQPFASADAPNRVWCADFKGWFRTADGERIDPLTITDACSRYLLRCQRVEKMDYERVRAIFEAAFRECGLPGAIRTDNGAPFASRAVAGLSRLAVWWMKLGIVPERIKAGHPEQNGRHERMHRTLKQETASYEEAAATFAIEADAAAATAEDIAASREFECRVIAALDALPEKLQRPRRDANPDALGKRNHLVC